VEHLTKVWNQAKEDNSVLQAALSRAELSAKVRLDSNIGAAVKILTEDAIKENVAKKHQVIVKARSKGKKILSSDTVLADIFKHPTGSSNVKCRSNEGILPSNSPLPDIFKLHTASSNAKGRSKDEEISSSNTLLPDTFKRPIAGTLPSNSPMPDIFKLHTASRNAKGRSNDEEISSSNILLPDTFKRPIASNNVKERSNSEGILPSNTVFPDIFKHLTASSTPRIVRRRKVFKDLSNQNPFDIQRVRRSLDQKEERLCQRRIPPASNAPCHKVDVFSTMSDKPALPTIPGPTSSRSAPHLVRQCDSPTGVRNVHQPARSIASCRPSIPAFVPVPSPYCHEQSDSTAEPDFFNQEQSICKKPKIPRGRRGAVQ
jgi:hypothetical protein